MSYHFTFWVKDEADGVGGDSPSDFLICPSSLFLGRYFHEVHRGLHKAAKALGRTEVLRLVG